MRRAKFSCPKHYHSASASPCQPLPLNLRNTRRAQQRLQTLVGVDPLVGMALTNTLERVLFRNADAFVVFTAFDPIANNSGHKTSLRRLSKRGPGELRRLAYSSLPFNFRPGKDYKKCLT